MFRTSLLLLVMFYSSVSFASLCDLVSNSGHVNIGDFNMGSLKKKNIYGKSYYTIKKSINITVQCYDAKGITISYSSQNDGKVYTLNNAKGFYIINIEGFNVNGRSEHLKYDGSNKMATRFHPTEKLYFIKSEHSDYQNISMSLEFEVYIEPTTQFGDVSADGEIIINTD